MIVVMKHLDGTTISLIKRKFEPRFEPKGDRAIDTVGLIDTRTTLTELVLCCFFVLLSVI